MAAGTGYAVLALLLALVRAAPERAALLARLRTMGLTRGQGRRLLVLEALPQALLAAAGGTLTGWATIRLLAPGIDLTSVALATPGGDPRPARPHCTRTRRPCPARPDRAPPGDGRRGGPGVVDGTAGFGPGTEGGDAMTRQRLRRTT